MIQGRVGRQHEAVIGCEVNGPKGSLRLDVVIDTGLNGDLSLEASVIQELGLKATGAREGTLADGSVVEFDSYLAETNWLGQLRAITVIDSAGGNLLGMELLEGQRLTIDVVNDGLVTVQSLSAGASDN